MWIRSIELNNFQKHEKFTADFVQGVNSIIGETDKGKSCVVRAMRWVLFNEPKGDIVRKFGTKLTTVALVLDTGVKVVRSKGASVNAYEIMAPGKEPVRFDSVGISIPEEVRAVLQADLMNVDKQDICLNMSSQLEAPFMLSETGGFRMKVLNKLVGSDILDLVSQDLNKDILRIGRDEKGVEEELTKAKETLGRVVADKLLKERQLSAVRGEHGALEKLCGEHTAVFEGLRDLRVLKTEILNIEKALTEVVVPEDLPQLKKLSTDFNSARVVKVRFDEVAVLLQEVAGKIDAIAIPEGVEEARQLSSRHKEVKKLVERAVTVETDLTGVQPLFETIKGQVDALRKAYGGLLKEYGKCPVCHTAVTEEVLKGIEL